MKLIVVLLALATFASAQTQQERSCLLGATGQACGHWVSADQYPSVVAEYRPKHNWFRRHPVLTGLIGAAVVGAATVPVWHHSSLRPADHDMPKPVGGPVMDVGQH